LIFDDAYLEVRHLCFGGCEWRHWIPPGSDGAWCIHLCMLKTGCYKNIHVSGWQSSITGKASTCWS